MGIRSDLFVATNSDALLYESMLEAKQATASGRCEIVHHSGLGSLEFGTLWAILAGVEWDVEQHMLQNLTAGDEGETWLDEFPSAYVTLLASINEQSAANAAEAWGKTEELQCPGKQLTPVVQDLGRLARLALAEKKGLYLWGSL